MKDEPISDLQDAWKSGYETAMHDMEHLRERDKAKRPTETWKYRGYGDVIGLCPNCGLSVSQDFCPYCGQRIDWSEE